MINIRFHVVSLVAVFLALGVGVAMGASFIDRATVESMRGRVDDLEAGFRERGDQLDQYGDVLRRSDEAAAALSEPASRAIDGTLAAQNVVLVVPGDVPEDTTATLLDTVANASASVVGTLTLQPELSPQAQDGEVPSDRVEVLRGALLEPGADEDGGDGSSTGQPSDPGAAPSVAELDTAEEVVVAARSALAEALAVLSAAPPATDAPGTTEREVAARALLERFGDAGLITLDTVGQPVETAFPQTIGVRYVLVVATGTDPPASSWTVPFAETYGAASSSTMVVAGVASPRAPGELRESVPDDTPLEVLLDPLRTGAASNEVTTVQLATDPLARLSLVYGLAAQTEGIVGHYGLGEGVAEPYPPAAQE